MEIQLWRSILCPYELAVRELIVKFEHIISEQDVYKRQVFMSISFYRAVSEAISSSWKW